MEFRNLRLLLIVATFGLITMTFLLGDQIQLGILLIFSWIAISLRHPVSILKLTIVVVPFLGLIRRVTDTQTGFEILPLLPAVGCLIALLASHAFNRGAKPSRGTPVASMTILVLLAFSALTLVLRARTVDAVYDWLLLATALLVLLMTVNGDLKSLIPWFKIWLPVLGLIAGLYGVIQFAFLPEWDRMWMESVGLTSIGRPAPYEVRVFGPMESPGPFANFMGICVIAAFTNALSNKSFMRFFYFIISFVLLIPVLLTGVRSVLVGIGLSVIVLGFISAKGVAKLLPLAFVAIAWPALEWVVGRFGAQSEILTAERLTNFDADTDYSFQSRLNILDVFPNIGQYVVGDPNSYTVDNFWVDILVSFGIVAFVSSVILTVLIVANLTKRLSDSYSQFIICAVFYIICLGAAGNFMLSATGIVFGILMGSIVAIPSVSNANKFIRTTS